MKYQGGKLYEEMRKFKDKSVNNKINCIPLISFDCEFDNISVYKWENNTWVLHKEFLLS